MAAPADFNKSQLALQAVKFSPDDTGDDAKISLRRARVAACAHRVSLSAPGLAIPGNRVAEVQCQSIDLPSRRVSTSNRQQDRLMDGSRN